jgi:hypothetical protein
MPALPSYLLGEFQFRNESDLKTIVEEAHNKACLPGRLEIPMESFVRAVEIVLKESELRDKADYRPDPTMWTHAVRHCGYVQSRHATGNVLATA